MSFPGNVYNAIATPVQNAWTSLTGPGKPTDLSYDQQALRIKRQQALADALREQANSPIAIQSSGGIQAPIPWMAVLAKALQGGAASVKEGRAEKMQTEMSDADKAANAKLVEALTGTVSHPGTPGIAPIQTQVSGAMPQLPGQAPQGPGAGGAPTADISVGGQQGTDMTQGAPYAQQQLAALAAAQGGGPMVNATKALYTPIVANEIAAQRQAQMAWDEKLKEQGLSMSTAKSQEIAAQAAAQQQTAAAANALPATAGENLSYQAQMANVNKPQPVSYGSPGYMQGGTYHAFPGGGAGSGVGAQEPDAEGKSPQAILGISGNAYNLLIGNTQAVAKGRPMDLASKELDQAILKQGLDPTIVKPRIAGYQDNVKINTMKANAIDTESANIIGTVDNIQPIADRIAPNDIRLVNGIYQAVGSSVNNKDAQKYAMYLTNLRSELAGLNAVLSGKIGLHGQIEVNETHQREAEKTIQDGLSRGGAQGIKEAITESKDKSVNIANRQAQTAERGIWMALGLGPKYDALHPQGPGNGGSTSKTLSAHDQQALEWANANPKDPRAAVIKKGLGR